MTDCEQALIDAALNVFSRAKPYELSYMVSRYDWERFEYAVDALCKERAPKPRFVTRPSGFGEAVWDTETGNFVPPSECARRMSASEPE